MKRSPNNILTFIIFISTLHGVQAQTFIGDLKINDESQSHILILKDGKTKTGRILSIKNTEVVFWVDDQKDTVIHQLFNIDKIMVKNADLDLMNIPTRTFFETEEEKTYGKTIPPVRGNNRLFYTETGFSLQKGESEYYTIRGLVHNFDYGFMDGVTVGLGFIYPGYLTGHVKLNYIGNLISSKLRAGFDFSVAVRPEDREEDESFTGFIKMGTYFSYGTTTRNIHLGLSVIPILEQDIDDFLISFNFGGTLKVAPHWKIIYENAFGGSDFGGLFGFFSGLGVNWFNDKNGIKAGITTSPNFGFINIPLNDLNSSSQLPFFSYSRYF